MSSSSSSITRLISESSRSVRSALEASDVLLFVRFVQFMTISDQGVFRLESSEGFRSLYSGPDALLTHQRGVPHERRRQICSVSPGPVVLRRVRVPSTCAALRE